MSEPVSPSQLNVGVIGAGPAGMTAAVQLVRAGHRVSLFEAGPHVGGMARSFDLWGQRVDVGPHRFFSKDPRVNRFWLEWAGSDYHMVDRLTRIFYGGHLYHYPLKAANALRNMGPFNALACLASYGRQKFRAEGEDKTFEQWVTRRFGSRLYHMFFKTYSEKLWGIPCTELDADFAAQRIKKFSLGEAILKASGLSRQRHATLVDEFAYPSDGCGVPYERMRDGFVAAGGELHMETPVRRVLHSDRTVMGLELSDGTRREFDHVISTMPLTLMVKGLDGTPQAVHDAAAKLSFRNTIIVYLQVQGETLFEDQWLYIHDARLQTGRVTNFSNWGLKTVPGQTILALEYWCYDDDPDWTADDASLIERATREIAATGLTHGAPVTAGHVLRIKRCYPVYNSGYQEHVRTVVDYLRTFRGLTPIGRYGAFKYNNQDHSILMGLFAAENIAAGQELHNLWDINTDYSYQEEAVISRNGLEVVGAASA